MPDYRPIFPSLFTAGNIVCGFLSLISAAEGEPTHAAWFIILGGFLDGLDGKVARLSGGVSALGKEMDALADFVSFGVAPAFLLQTLKLPIADKWSWMIGLVYILAAGYRLARFNLLASSDEKKCFLGLPVPAAAITLVSFIIMSYRLFGGIEYHEFLISMTILLSALMVSQIEYDAVPDTFGTREGGIKLLYIIVAVLAALIWPRLLVFPFFAVYILAGLAREAVRVVKLARSHRKNGAA